MYSSPCLQREQALPKISPSRRNRTICYITTEIKHFQNTVLMYFGHDLEVKPRNGGKIRRETKCSEIKFKENSKMGD